MTPLDTPCIEWDGARRRHGYGYLKVRGRQVLAHRWAWEQKHGPIPDGLCVLHRCDNPPCVGLDHLFLGTKGENNADRHSKGRDSRHIPPSRGSLNGRARLDEAAIAEIRALIAAGHPKTDIARSYGVGKSAISKIATGRRWSHV